MDGSRRDVDSVEPGKDYLTYLTVIERSPNTVRAYAHSLKLWFEFLAAEAVEWDRRGQRRRPLRAWLRSPADNVIVLDASAARRAPRR